MEPSLPVTVTLALKLFTDARISRCCTFYFQLAEYLQFGQYHLLFEDMKCKNPDLTAKSAYHEETTMVAQANNIAASSVNVTSLYLKIIS